MTGARLLADVGGTNVRFACATSSHEIVEHREWRVSAFSDFCDALNAYLAETGGGERYRDAAVAAAGPLLCGAIALTNASWRIAVSDVSDTLGGVPTRLINDLEAVALSLPYIPEEDLRWIGRRHAVPGRQTRMIALNVGTGVGAATLLCANGVWLSVPSEAGHMSLGAHNEAELRLFDGCRERTSTVEEVLSGEGLPLLYAKVNRQTGMSASLPKTSYDIISHCNDDPIANETVRIMTVVLGRVAGNLALASAAWGGVYFCGSVAREWAAITNTELFRKHFEDKGKLSRELRKTPTAVITNEYPALIGLAHAEIQIL